MTELGWKAPSFSIPDVLTGELRTLDEISRSKGCLVMFICRHCPYVLHVKPTLIQLGIDYLAQPIGFVAISSNDAVRYPDDAPEHLAELAREFSFPLLYDETQAVAKAYRAACTPDFFLLDGAGHLVYRGQLDDSRPGNNQPLTGKDLRMAIDALIAGRPINPEQHASIGCSIKWKQGNEPDYSLR